MAGDITGGNAASEFVERARNGVAAFDALGIELPEIEIILRLYSCSSPWLRQCRRPSRW
ncbi:hypothetical protein GCM10009864_72370 [Streptomyces lunalinharesii]|uniref:Uncharacterized protein n=1 Tax=Streptomyces lunalinharesii TaxID=333384 RepID=A0ABN3SXP1_9ACTN